MTRPIAEQQEQDRLRALGLKRCTKCEEEKPLSEFGSRPKNRDGLMNWCRDCYKKYHQKWNDDNPGRAKENKRRYAETEKCQAYYRQYRAEHADELNQKRHDYHEQNREIENKKNRERYQRDREKVLARIKEYRQTAKDKRRETNRAWLKAHPEKRREFKLRYKIRYPDKVRASDSARSKIYRQTHRKEMSHRQARRRALIRNAPGTHDVTQWEKLVELCGGKCLICGEHEGITCDHIIPLSWGGSDYLTNVQPLCLRCNAKKQDCYAADYRPLPARAWAYLETYGMLSEEESGYVLDLEVEVQA